MAQSLSSCAFHKAPGQWLSPEWFWQRLEICTSDLGDSQVGHHGEPTGHLEHAQPTIAAGGIQDKQPKNTELLSYPAGGHPPLPSSPWKNIPVLQMAEAVSLMVPVSHQLCGANGRAY